MGSANDVPLCSGSEDLKSMKNFYSDFSKLRISYNVYKAVYAIAHAVKSMKSCKKEAGPFLLNAWTQHCIFLYAYFFLS